MIRPSSEQLAPLTPFERFAFDIADTMRKAGLLFCDVFELRTILASHCY